MSEYPKWKFHKELMPLGKIVYSEAESKKLGHEWVESPNDFEKKKEKEVEKEVKKADSKLEEKAADSDKKEVKPAKKNRFNKKG